MQILSIEYSKDPYLYLDNHQIRSYKLQVTTEIGILQTTNTITTPTLNLHPIVLDGDSVCVCWRGKNRRKRIDLLIGITQERKYYLEFTPIYEISSPIYISHPLLLSTANPTPYPYPYPSMNQVTLPPTNKSNQTKPNTIKPTPPFPPSPLLSSPPHKLQHHRKSQGVCV